MKDTESVAVFWDYENCPVPSNASGYAVVNNISSLARPFGSVKVFKAYLEIFEKLPTSRAIAVRSELQSSGVTVIDCPHNGSKDVADKMILVDMLAYAIDNPAPSTIVLISGDKDFAYALSVLKLRRYRIVLVTLPNAHTSLTFHATMAFEWNADILNPVGKSAVLPIPNYRQPYQHERRSSDVQLNQFSPQKSFQRPMTYTNDQDASVGSELHGCIDIIQYMRNREPQRRPSFNHPAFAGQSQPNLRKQDSFNSPTFARASSSMSPKKSKRPLPPTGAAYLETPRPNPASSFSRKKTSPFHTPVKKPVELPVILDTNDGKPTPIQPNDVHATIDLPPSQPQCPTELDGEFMSNAYHDDVDLDLTQVSEVVPDVLNTGNVEPLSPSNSSPFSVGNPSPRTVSSTSTPVTQPAPLLSTLDDADTSNNSSLEGSNPAEDQSLSPSILAPIIDDQPTSYLPSACAEGEITVVTRSTSGSLTAADPSESPAPTPVEEPEEPTSYLTTPLLESLAENDEAVKLANYTETIKAETASTPKTSTPRTIPSIFEPLVKALQEHRAKKDFKPPRSTIALEISKNGETYKNAGVQKFKQYAELAQQQGIVELGGLYGDAWMLLKPEWYDAVDAATAAKLQGTILQSTYVKAGCAPCRFGPSCKRAGCKFSHALPSPCRFGASCTRKGCTFEHPKRGDLSTPSKGVSCASSPVVKSADFLPVDTTNASVPLAPPSGTNVGMSHAIAETDISQTSASFFPVYTYPTISSNGLSTPMLPMDTLGHMHLDAAPVSSNTIARPGASTIIPTSPVLQPLTSSTPSIIGAPYTPKKNAAATPSVFSSSQQKPEVPENFKVLVQILQTSMASGIYYPLRSVIGLELVKRNAYKRAGLSSFKDYIALAAKDGIVTLGGKDGHAWVSLQPEWRNAATS